jgi:hypothetical protein
MGNTADLASHPTAEQLEAGLEHVRQSPTNHGALRMIVRRPGTEERDTVDEGALDVDLGLVGDNWKTRGSSSTPDGSANPDMQLNVMNARCAALVAQDDNRWQLAGDQLYIDLNLSEENLPPGTRLAIGGAVIRVSEQPHTGCRKFVSRFGVDAMKFVNSLTGKRLRLRGLNASVVRPGTVRVGDSVRKVS